jgi:hypothetical protein
MNTQGQAQLEAWLQEPRPLPEGGTRIAEFVDVQLERVTVLWRTVAGHLCRSFYFPGLAPEQAPLTRVALEALDYRVRRGWARVHWSAGTVYHCWHVCYCRDCRRRGGRVWDHAQGSFDAHLRFVANDDLYTFPTAPEAR